MVLNYFCNLAASARVDLIVHFLGSFWLNHLIIFVAAFFWFAYFLSFLRQVDLLLLDVYLAALGFVHVLLLLFDYGVVLVFGSGRALVNLRQLLSHIRLRIHATSRKRWPSANTSRRRAQSLLIDEFRIQEHETLVHDLKRASH